MLSTAQFTYLKDSRCLAGEDSELRVREHLEQVWPDSADLGFTLVSHRTGKEVKVVHVRSERAVDGSLVFDEFRPIKGTKVSDDFSVVIFND